MKNNILIGVLFIISAIITISNIEIGDWGLGFVALLQIASAFVFFLNAIVTKK
jgi:hypothetical protein